MQAVKEACLDATWREKIRLPRCKGCFTNCAKAVLVLFNFAFLVSGIEDHIDEEISLSSKFCS